MFQHFGNFVIRYWPGLLLAWLTVVLASIYYAPPLESVIKPGEFGFMPADSPSLVAERLFNRAFAQQRSPSNIVIVIRRTKADAKLTDADRKFVDDNNDPLVLQESQAGDEAAEKTPIVWDLKDHLVMIAGKFGGIRDLSNGAEEETPETKPNGQPVDENAGLITAIRTYRDPKRGRFLESEDGKATLVLVELSVEFLDKRVNGPITAIEQLLFKDAEFAKQIPPGLDLSLSGAAVVGRDMMRAESDSAKSTEKLTVILVVILLIGIYRAPLLALIPLSTVFLSVALTMSLLKLMAKAGWVVLFQGVESYVTVLLYGGGVDYCLFLIARYKEELDTGATVEEAVANSLGKVGAAVTASAGTVICGIGMMSFAEFGKFHEAGIAIAFGLVIVLVASLTFTPSLLRWAGVHAFWPQVKTERIKAGTGWLPTAQPLKGLTRWLHADEMWDHMGDLIARRPAAVWLGSVAVMIPWAILGVMFYTHLSYGLLSDLPRKSPCVEGTAAVQDHFPAGAVGPTIVLLKNDQHNFSGSEGIQAIDLYTQALRDHRKELRLSEIRSVSHPTGGEKGILAMQGQRGAMLTRKEGVKVYVSSAEEFDRHLTRLELTTDLDPFARDSISHLDLLEKRLKELLPAELKGSELSILGTTVSIRDLKHVTDRDQVRIDLLVTGSVFIILVILLRKVALCVYLILTVLFSYLVTLGVTIAVFWMIDPASFTGLDWKVPMFLFTILIAVGEDYNIFLMTRIEEEQLIHGPVPGITQALSRTGRIISSCGIIMAGTFASLMAGSLKGMTQLGFALAFGVLLDTFVVRTVLVPAYLVLLHSGRLGTLGWWLGGSKPSATDVAQSAVVVPAPESAT